jgi:putative transposase
MIKPELRKQIGVWIAEAVSAGARLIAALSVLGLTARCFQRWKRRAKVRLSTILDMAEMDLGQDGRSTRIQVPKNQMTAAEKQAILETINRAGLADLPVTQIVPILADEGCYVGSESTMYRVMRANQQNRRRSVSKAPKVRALPQHFSVTVPNQLACWDITYLPSGVRGHYWYAYVVMDVYSRKAVAWQVYAHEDQQLASDLLRDYVANERIAPGQLTLHSDNGSVMRGSSLYATLQELKIAPSHSRASVSNDSPYIESLFRTIKYRPNDPLTPFKTLEDARLFMDRLLHWYNTEHRHSGIQYVTPNQRHAGEDEAILQRRREVYEAAKNRHPERWSGEIRNWKKVEVVHLNRAKNSGTGDAITEKNVVQKSKNNSSKQQTAVG